jgi:hypothetical protein
VEPNPEAIAWYVEEAQRLLEDQQRRAESLRSRGGQIAGFGAAVLALISGNAEIMLGAASGSAHTAIGLTFLVAVIFLAVATVIAVWGVIKPQPFVVVAADEIALYASERFLEEADLWRVHVRSLQSLEKAARAAQDGGNAAARAIMVSLYVLLTGLGFSLISLGTLIVVLI